jgi:hypothetical protein
VARRALKQNLPRLDAQLVADDKRLALTIDEATRTVPGFRRSTEAILRLQAELRDRLDDDQWRAFLRLDEAVTARFADLTVAVVRWAYAEGRRSGGRPRGGA